MTGPGHAERHTLLKLLAINAVMFVVELAAEIARELDHCESDHGFHP
jgi:hypothetical protein